MYVLPVLLSMKKWGVSRFFNQLKGNQKRLGWVLPKSSRTFWVITYYHYHRKKGQASNPRLRFSIQILQDWVTRLCSDSWDVQQPSNCHTTETQGVMLHTTTQKVVLSVVGAAAGVAGVVVIISSWWWQWRMVNGHSSLTTYYSTQFLIFRISTQRRGTAVAVVLVPQQE